MTEADLRSILLCDESSGIEFKPSLLSRKEIAEYSVGIGNSGGGLLIMGVTDRPPRTVQPIHLKPGELEQIRQSVADAARVRVELSAIQTSDGQVLVASIPGRPKGVVFHTIDGKYLIRLDDKLRGMTVAEIDAIRREAGQEFTSLPLPERWDALTSPSAMEELRRLMDELGAESDLIGQKDADLLRNLGVLDSANRFLMAGLLLVGKPEAIRGAVPHARWQFFRMLSDTDYDMQDGGFDSLVVAMKRMRELMIPNNPVTILKGVLHHPEFPRYPTLALRELLANALAHRDFETPGSVVLKVYPDCLRLSNPGGFVGGVTPENILHHPSTPRNAALFNALARFRLANASNLGVPRIFREFLREGKEPPVYSCPGQSIVVYMKGQEARQEFLGWVGKTAGLDVDDLLILHHLTRHREVKAVDAAVVCQRTTDQARELLSRLAVEKRLLEICGSGKGQFYRLARSAYQELSNDLEYFVDRKLSEENARVRILDTLAERDLTNEEIREITQLSRYSALRLMKKLQKSGKIELIGKGRSSKWILIKNVRAH